MHESYHIAFSYKFFGQFSHTLNLQGDIHVNAIGALHNILREHATENGTTVDLPCPPSSRGEAAAAQRKTPG
jgi:hypothetical protein